MRSDNIKLYKELLIGRMTSILGTAGETLDSLSNEGDPFPDPVDRALSESSNSIELRKRDRERKLLQKIKKAIQKTEDGSYGICEDCGGNISASRLKVRPEAMLCINCKEEQEKIEKQFGK